MDESKYPDITSKEIRAYCEKWSKEGGQHLSELQNKSEITAQTKMLSGPFLGRFLSLISKILNPQTILELGTFTGYGTLCLAEGLRDNGKIITIEKNAELKQFYSEYVTEMNPHIDIVQHIGDAAEIIPKLEDTFDLVFIDAAKRQYKNYYDLLFDKLNPGGVVLADNVLWKAKVVTKDVDKLGQGLMTFNEYIYNDDRVDNIILPIDDGINLIRKK
ncbi:MAG: O-methyltransferase [Saprospiraceae bacterium]|nr:O-methyltransferase [Bacteroidia bacterium]NNE14851.1 O-methyltransferase [Saprospiraceae bacterium]NNL91893.1 O-methyltransferase [Saprospiraceae bacterium]